MAGNCACVSQVLVIELVSVKGNNVVVKTVEELADSHGRGGEEGAQKNADIEKRHAALNEESVVSLTDILEAASQDEMIPRYVCSPLLSF